MLKINNEADIQMKQREKQPYSNIIPIKNIKKIIVMATIFDGPNNYYPSWTVVRLHVPFICSIANSYVSVIVHSMRCVLGHDIGL